MSGTGHAETHKQEKIGRVGSHCELPSQVSNFTNVGDCAKKLGVVRRRWPTWLLVGPCHFLRGRAMCAFTTAAGCIECRVIWKRKRRSCVPVALGSGMDMFWEILSQDVSVG